MANRRLGLAQLGIGLFAFLGLATQSCGVRSSFPELEPCYEVGAQRYCQSDCGVGIQHCRGGAWQACETPKTTRACNNDCGAGTQTCSEGSWSECAVQDTTRSCTNNCGTGTQSCTNDTWSQCAVQDTTRSCTNNCGTGTQLCTNDTWQECIVTEQVAECTNNCGVGTKTCKDNTWGECKVDHQEKACSSTCGPGKLTCDNNVWTDCDAPQPLPPKLHATIRDFRENVPLDFGKSDVTYSIDDRGFVQSLLDSDDKPVYALTGPSLTVQGPDTFAEWYRDVAGVNTSTEIDLPLTQTSTQPVLYTYHNTAFFPIDGQLFGNEGREHNYNFTLEAKAQFTFQGNERFTFEGDDDVFVFINRHLAIDLGGIHGAETMTVDLAASAQRLEIAPGNRYWIHIFFAERHPTQSDFLVTTSIADIGSCPAP